ncbi:MAG TPA: hypothetical protein VER76_21455 [Pyrinomonadaceae bacterium]|nr:hypothetical protein [Pyrinomonadaceae bacterium]
MLRELPGNIFHAPTAVQHKTRAAGDEKSYARRVIAAQTLDVRRLMQNLTEHDLCAPLMLFLPARFMVWCELY